jgi:hypothetical protein
VLLPKVRVAGDLALEPGVKLDRTLIQSKLGRHECFTGTIKREGRTPRVRMLDALVERL